MVYCNPFSFEYSFVVDRYFRYYFLFANIGWLILTSFFGGVDHLAVLATRRRYGKEVKKEE